MCVHNAGHFLAAAVDSILTQTLSEFEFLIIDDGSTDLTPYLVATTSARLVRHASNRGKAVALNSGLAAARGEVIVTCDGDG